MDNITYIHNMSKLPGRYLLSTDEIAAMIEAPLQNDVPLLIQDISLRSDLMLLLAETLASIKLCPAEDCDRCNSIRFALREVAHAYGIGDAGMWKLTTSTAIRTVLLYTLAVVAMGATVYPITLFLFIALGGE